MIIDTDKLWKAIDNHFTERAKKIEAIPNCNNVRAIKLFVYLEIQELKEKQTIRDLESLVEDYLN